MCQMKGLIKITWGIVSVSRRMLNISKYIILIFLSVLLSVVNADNKNQDRLSDSDQSTPQLDLSIPKPYLQEPPAQSDNQSIDLGNSKQQQQSEHCSRLSRQIEALKGKPQRRAAAVERYKLECTNNKR